MNTKVILGVVTNRQVKAKTTQSLLELMAYSKHEITPMVVTRGYTISENRNYLAVQVQNKMCDYLLFIDDDMVFPKETLDILLNHEKDIIGVASHQRKLPIVSTVEMLEKDQPMPNELFECKAVGAGVLLIKTEVFRKLEGPWFNVKTNPLGLTLVGEDSWFCDKARENNFKVWCDPTIKIGHIGDYEY